MIGCYPGSFEPPTVAHLAVAEAAVEAAELDRLDLVVSRVALGKEHLGAPSLAERVAVLEAVAATRPWLGVAVTDARLIIDIARPYDAVVMGADKWRQVNDPAWYLLDANAPGRLPQFRFIVLDRLDPAQITQVYGPPNGTLRCAGSEVWTYDDPDQVREALLRASPALAQKARR